MNLSNGLQNLELFLIYFIVFEFRRSRCLLILQEGCQTCLLWYYFYFGRLASFSLYRPSSSILFLASTAPLGVIFIILGRLFVYFQAAHKNPQIACSYRSPNFDRSWLASSPNSPCSSAQLCWHRHARILHPRLPLHARVPSPSLSAAYCFWACWQSGPRRRTSRMTGLLWSASWTTFVFSLFFSWAARGAPASSTFCPTPPTTSAASRWAWGLGATWGRRGGFWRGWTWEWGGWARGPRSYAKAAKSLLSVWVSAPRSWKRASARSPETVRLS